MAGVSIQRYFLYSILVHASIVLLLLLFHRLMPAPALRPQTISLEFLDQSTVVATPPEAKKNREDEKKVIVEQERLNNEIDPLANHLSSHNQKVIKETVAKNHGDFQNRKASPLPPGVQVPRGAKAPTLSPNVPSRTRPLPKDLFGSSKEAITNSFQQKMQTIQGGESSGADVSRTRDYLPDKEAGAETILSTREFVYFTYYNRIRNQLSQYWEPKIKQKVMALFKKGRRIASDQDRITKVKIVLDSKGELVGVQVVGASGVQDLDEAAVEAFRAAAPFPNPPKGIIEQDGTVKIEWDFVVEV